MLSEQLLCWIGLSVSYRVVLSHTGFSTNTSSGSPKLWRPIIKLFKSRRYLPCDVFFFPRVHTFTDSLVDVASESLTAELLVWSAGLPEGGPLALRAVWDQDHQRVQDATRQSAVHTAHVLHHHEPPQPGQWRLCPRGGRLRPRARLCPHQGECVLHPQSVLSCFLLINN